MFFSLSVNYSISNHNPQNNPCEFQIAGHCKHKHKYRFLGFKGSFRPQKILDEHRFMLDSLKSCKSLFGKNPTNNKCFICKKKYNFSIFFFYLFIFEIRLYVRYGTYFRFIHIVTLP